MKVSVAKLVNVILERMAFSNDKPPSEKAMRSYLLQEGYKRCDIDTALELISTHLAERPVYKTEAPAIRQLAFYEAAKIHQDVHHAMTRLEIMGLLDPFEREFLLERFIHTEGQADMEALDFALSYVIGAARNVEAQQALLSVFEGFSPTYH